MDSLQYGKREILKKVTQPGRIFPVFRLERIADTCDYSHAAVDEKIKTHTFYTMVHFIAGVRQLDDFIAGAASSIILSSSRVLSVPSQLDLAEG